MNWTLRDRGNGGGGDRLGEMGTEWETGTGPATGTGKGEGEGEGETAEDDGGGGDDGMAHRSTPHLSFSIIVFRTGSQILVRMCRPGGSEAVMSPRMKMLGRICTPGLNRGRGSR